MGKVLKDKKSIDFKQESKKNVSFLLSHLTALSLDIENENELVAVRACMVISQITGFICNELEERIVEHMDSFERAVKDKMKQEFERVIDPIIRDQL